MQVLKIIEGLRSELTKNGVVICTFIKDGIEFDKDGNVIFEYFYNEAEEISKKIEYEYHNNGKRIKKEVNY